MSELYKMHKGKTIISPKGLALLFGVTEEQIRNLPITNGGVQQVPELWVKRGRRISKEAKAALGTDSLLEVLDHLAAQAERQP